MLIDFIISPAFAETASAQGSPLLNLLPLVLLFAVFYFILIRPQQKKAKQHKSMIASLKVGDEVVSHGGLLGRIVHTDESFLQVEVASGMVVNLQRHGISALMPNGTYKSVESDKGSFNKRPDRRRSGSRSDGQNRVRPNALASSRNTSVAKEGAKAIFDKGIKRQNSDSSGSDSN